MDLLSKQNVLAVLENCLKSRDFQLQDYTIQPFGKPLEGLIGDHYDLLVTYKIPNQVTPVKTKFFVKTLSRNRVMFEISTSIRMFDKEKLFYTVLVPEYRKFGIDCSFIPEGYFFADNTVVLEDLGEIGYKGTSKREPLDLNHCLVCLETLAQFHGSNIIYECKKRRTETNYTVFGQFPDLLEDKFMSAADNGATRYLKSAISGLFELIDILPEGRVSGEDFKRKLSETVAELTSGDAEGLVPQNSISTILHGDLWSSNFLYIYEGDKPSRAKLVDFQTVHYGPLEMDLMQFLMTNTRRQFRDKNLPDLIAHYHAALKRCLIAEELDNLLPSTPSDFAAVCDFFRVPAKLHALVDRSLTFQSNEIYADALQSEETLQKFLFEDRGKYIVDACNVDPQYRSVLFEDMLELRELLGVAETATLEA